MDWIDLHSLEQLDEINTLSQHQAVVIFKHSTRCSISHMAKSRLEREPAPSNIPFYYLDLIQHRPISQSIAEKYDVHHESPQILIIKNGVCIYDQSHNGITMADTKEQIQ
ncbi:MAG TPA: bacillithiol system redox-active protein YtxJ [Chitinophagaceae bacterium]|nr:bacillithiol system redox-active protein YtxJ [Chitinophagaceae bacterium]